MEIKIVIKEVKSRGDLKKFIYLPEELHRDHKQWVPPIYADEWKYFDPRKNRSFSHSDTILLLASREGREVGRVMGIVNNRYNEIREEKTARFSYLETVEDEEVVRALLNSIEDWARQRGLKKLIGPYGFTDQDPEGFQIEGFEYRATIASYANFEWMPGMVERQGYTKDVDYFVYKLDIPKVLPEFYIRIYERVKKKGNFEVLDFVKKSEIKPLIKPVLHLMNECYIESNIYGYTPLDEKEMQELAKRYLPILNPRYVKCVKREDELVAFIIGIPDMTEGIQKAKGKLFPWGFVKILRAAKRTKQLDLLLGAVKDQYRGLGLDVLMGVRMLMSAHEGGLERIDTHHELESNVKVRAEMEKMGGKIYKRFRVYQKTL